MKPVKKTLPRLYVVSNCRELPSPEIQLPELVSRISSHLPVIIQLREKHLSAKALYELTLKVTARKPDSAFLLSINERFDISLATNSDGVHLPENSCPLAKVRSAAPDLLIGKSTHSLKEAVTAESDGADYLFFGPVFETPLKKRYGPPMGLDKLATVCSSVSIPVYAIGGITPQNAAHCLEHGAYGVAAMSIFTSTQNLVRTLDNFHSSLDR
ncbi:MAG: thiamine phosphate synthase [Chlorobium phaeobacteroides]|uniref:Thiamine-phosphate synthase n=1 Tax=Chlorobium phaeobacteroides (strain BS1) TaxID=331678 RepID=B3EJ14_CHLPB|nr:thiamine phosphate synthase [Chlorobium phaeobacteroides]MBL6956448.1 thiamine phosphate synthase [Chlorobium phaeobacteroides]